ncbi:MAG: Xylose isomerase protein barrel [Acidimicrobiaceae bacterium]|nr:Xylose isomerase protein barrel [Acidimicrobiaceae bacterium]
MQFGIESLPFHDFSLGTTAQAVADLGFRWINLWDSAPPLAHHVDVGKDSPAEVLATLDRLGLRASGVTMYGKSQEEIAQGVRFAAAVGAGRVIFDCEATFADFVDHFLPPLLEEAGRNGVDICVENHLTVPFSADFEAGGHEAERWEEGVDSFAQIKRLVTELDHPNLKVCMAPSHLWVMEESIIEVATWLLERKKLGYCYVWDISSSYRRGEDGLNFGPGEEQLPRVGGTLDHGLILRALSRLGYDGIAALKCHGTAGWPFDKVTSLLAQSRDYLVRTAGADAFAKD